MLHARLADEIGRSEDPAARRRRLAERSRTDERDPTPRISVVIPTFNRTDTLAAVLRSYAVQSLAPRAFELLLVDNASDPDTAELIENLIDHEPLPYQLRYVRVDPNRGPCPARNVGIRAARAPIVLIACDDTIATPDLLAEHLAAHDARPLKTVAVVGHIAWAADAPLTSLMRYTTDVSGNQYAFFAIRDRENAGIQFFYGSNLSVKRAFLLEQDELFDPTMIYGYEDVELGYRLAKRGMRLVYHPPAVVYHRHFYDLEAFCRRMFRVSEMAPLLARKHPELHGMVLGCARPDPKQPHDLLDTMPLIRTFQAAAMEIDRMDLDALDVIRTGEQPLGAFLHAARCEMYQSAIQRSINAGLQSGFMRLGDGP